MCKFINFTSNYGYGGGGGGEDAPVVEDARGLFPLLLLLALFLFALLALLGLFLVLLGRPGLLCFGLRGKGGGLLGMARLGALAEGIQGRGQ